MAKKKKSKRKHKKKLINWEQRFIKEQGQELHDILLEDIPELRTSPQYWESLAKLAPMPIPPYLKYLYDRFMQTTDEGVQQ